MKIVIGSPDGLGDFVLRMPLVEALLATKHQVQMVMCPLAAELARDLFPEVQVLVLRNDPFRAETKRLRRPFHREIAEIRRFAPDLYIASAFQLNFFDEIFLKEKSSQIRVAGFEAEEDFWPSDTSLDPRELVVKHFNIRVRVPSVMPEGDKNLRLAATVLGSERVKKVAPRPPSHASLTSARMFLAEHGIQEGEFVVVCAGSRPGLMMKDWGEKHWAKLFKCIGHGETRSFLFLGNPKESSSIERLRTMLPTGTKHLNLALDPPSVPVSYALVSMAGAYLGRDSGVMHLAAAANVPILAVFSGGHWPRFLPEASRGIILTRKTPCRGCHFYCPFPEPWCVTTIPVETVVEAWHRLPAVRSLEVEELPDEGEFSELARITDLQTYWNEQIIAARQKNMKLQSRSLWRKMFGNLKTR